MCRFIHLDEMSSTWHKKQLGLWKEFPEAPGNPCIQVGIRIAKDDPHWPSELCQLLKPL